MYECWPQLIKTLRKEIEEGNFREDLYHRLNVIPIHVPSLNDRKDDIPILAKHFLAIICEDQGLPLKEIDESGYNSIKECQLDR